MLVYRNSRMNSKQNIGCRLQQPNLDPNRYQLWYNIVVYNRYIESMQIRLKKKLSETLLKDKVGVVRALSYREGIGNFYYVQFDDIDEPLMIEKSDLEILSDNIKVL
jgi:hypothetical protein